ncbi:DUF2989 domain-containing protein [Pseudoalteromonas tunicata]|jgi:hypothetical protein|uniref:DUF2989 domain-containing protein n=1 Tax=Pseudoalteromonas tunicata D2 TaxID=87626 RepID=A4CB56_9GAMM|nr:DUF2989 domain-containing protein [Pseudoalteromonas tunicata]ATC95153.1 hypothetical protein PTUN_a2714 [Pseudoalteromonas tunicata]AXT30773.1 DUF2989 domain-containing protein [Pseudoalteromonas tunicata]EAR28614.1 hypothetical protein PTD2_22402 [Pseudoalteromonas tunicata D2]MDP4983863.1 DUF2989 domain-containing protein [Pseudoalteromonas tunicata]MDP5215478.1 DUF2989 domain-containing protein [Pseudoalteromonas tunicata]
MKLAYLLFLSTLLLVGCDSQISVREVCEQSPLMCEDLNTDGHCNFERSDVIVARYYEKQQPTDVNKFTLLNGFEKYSKCIHLASGIEHIKLKDKKTSRMNGYLTSLKEIKRLSQETVNSQLPQLLYYHWSRNGSEQALEQLLQQENQPSMQTSELQFLLATYYIKFDLDKTITLLYRSLELYKGDKPINQEIFTTLVNLFYKQKNYKNAYIWGLIAQESGGAKIDLAGLENLLAGEGKSIESLEDLADKTLSDIQDGKFVSPRN